MRKPHGKFSQIKILIFFFFLIFVLVSFVWLERARPPATNPGRSKVSSGVFWFVSIKKKTTTVKSVNLTGTDVVDSGP